MMANHQVLPLLFRRRSRNLEQESRGVAYVHKPFPSDLPIEALETAFAKGARSSDV